MSRYINPIEFVQPRVRDIVFAFLADGQPSIDYSALASGTEDHDEFADRLLEKAEHMGEMDGLLELADGDEDVLRGAVAMEIAAHIGAACLEYPEED